MKTNHLIPYTAGIIDGEGHVKAYPNSNGKLYPRIVVVQNDRRLLEWLKEQFGGCISKHGERAGRWQLSGKKAVQLAKDCLPYLIVKKEAALSLIGGPRD